VMIAQLGDRIHVAGVDGVQEFLGLTMKLFEVAADGQTANGHHEPSARSRGPLASGKGGSVIGTCPAVASSDGFHVGAQPIQEPIPCLWRTSWSPNCLEGGAGRLGMVQGRDKDLCDIRAGDSIPQG
jgi:hypothetical protein